MKYKYLQVAVSLIQQVSDVRGHVPYYRLHVIGVHLTRIQPLQIQHILLTVGQLLNMHLGINCTKSAAAFKACII